MPITRIEIDFALPVELTTNEQMALDKVIGHICNRTCPEGWAFWPAGYGNKPHFSKADARFLGVPVDSDAPESGEPTWDDSIYYIECAARELHPEEIERRKQKAVRAEKSRNCWPARLADWFHRRGCKRLSWWIADAYFWWQRRTRTDAPHA